MTKTIGFAAGAVVAIALAVVASMPSRFGKLTDDAEAPLFKDFDPSLAQSMKIVKFDEDTSTKHEFEIAHTTDDKGRKLWVIKSHKNYPADANTQLADTASALVSKERGSQVSSNKILHGQFGVRNPSEEIKFRHVQLLCGDRVFSEADNWYVPGRLTPDRERAKPPSRNRPEWPTETAMSMLGPQEFVGMRSEIDHQQSAAGPQRSRRLAQRPRGVVEIVQDLMHDYEVIAVPFDG